MTDFQELFKNLTQEENPQTPKTEADAKHPPTSGFVSILMSDDEDLQVVAIDPDRPPLSKCDHRKLKNSLKSKAKK
jgi:hypothetical protein